MTDKVNRSLATLKEAATMKEQHQYASTAPGGSQPLTSRVVPYPDILPEQELVGSWETIEKRTMDITVRVSTFRGKTNKKSIAEYHISKVPLPPNSVDAIAAWRFDKTLPDVERYMVCLHQDGRLSCDCKHATLSNHRDSTLCVHQSAIVTLADTFKEVVLPTPTTGVV